jgi:peptide chain release factor 2
MQKPGFWDDQQRAAAHSSEHSRARRKLDDFRRLESQIEDLADLAALDDESLEQELGEQLDEVERHLSRLEEERLFGGRYDAGDAVVTVHSGAGGTDSQDWAEMLLRMYLRWAQKRGFEVEMKEASPGEEAGIKSATFIARGENAYGLFSAEKGVHRLVRLSPFDAARRRHTSFALLEVSPLVEGDVDVEIDESDLRIETYRASGAGGQHVNKTDSAVRITHLPTKIVVQCQNERSQSSNKQTAMKFLRSKLVELEERRRREELAREKGEAEDVGWGSQIRSYVLHPYTRVKDHRTGYEMGDAARVLDGDLDGFVHEYLVRSAGQKNGPPSAGTDGGRGSPAKDNPKG